MLTMMALQAGRRPPRLRLPSKTIEWAGTLAGQLGILGADLLQAIRHFQPLDTSKARAELGITSRAFAETVRDALTWFYEQGYLRNQVDGRQ